MNLKFSKKLIYSFIVMAVLVISIVGVYAYNTSNPSVFGHSAGEVEVTINNVTTTLQQAIDNRTIGGAGWEQSGTIVYYNGGNVGIGSATPSQKLYVAGNMQATGAVYGGAFYYSSDRNLKTNIQPISNALDKVQQLQGVTFDWKEDGSSSVGLIAQDVEEVFPELVHTDAEGKKSVEYANLVAVLIEAVKEQQKEIDELKAQLGE